MTTKVQKKMKMTMIQQLKITVIEELVYYNTVLHEVPTLGNPQLPEMR